MTPEEMRLYLGDFTEVERKRLRQGEYWETCFQAWLDSGRPSTVRAWLKEDEEIFLRWMDSRAWSLAKAVELAGADEVETMKDLFPMWEDPDMPDEEIEAEQELTQQERKAAKDQFL